MLGGAHGSVASRVVAVALALALSGGPRLVAEAQARGHAGAHRCQCPKGQAQECACPNCHREAVGARGGAIEKLTSCHLAAAGKALADKTSCSLVARGPCLTGSCGAPEEGANASGDIDDVVLPVRPDLVVPHHIVERVALAESAPAGAPRAPETPPPRGA